MNKIKFQLTYEYEASIDVETGELVDIKCLGKVEDKTPEVVKEKKKTTSRKKKTEESSTPQLTLSDNKCCLNTAAVELIGVEAGDKLDINYEKYGSGFRPVLSLSEKGNKLTKSHTIALRGSKNEALAKYGTIFNVVAHESKPNSYLLKGDNEEIKEETEVI